MNRRSFLSGILTTAVAPMFLAGAGRKWVTSKSGIVIQNPDYADAPWEVKFCYDLVIFETDATPKNIAPIVYERYKGFFVPTDKKLIDDPFPIRFDVNKNPVPPFIKVISREYNLS